MKIQDYITTEPFELGDIKLPSGSFVKPIDLYWIPKHVSEAPQNRWFDSEKQTYVYCHFGIIVIPLAIIRKA